jgi:bifunctional non-homologous end joining protein LigD
VAVWLRDRMSTDGLKACAKTSGSKGLHLLAPLDPTPSGEVTSYARSLAVEAEAEFPSLVTHRMARNLRPAKVFVDFSQNAARKTTATPYTLRARRGPTVSAPVTWDEVTRCTRPAQLTFHAQDMPARLHDHGDLMAPLFDAARAARLP